MPLKDKTIFPKQCGWDLELKKTLSQQWYKTLQSEVIKQRSDKNIFPPADSTFNAFKITPFKNVKVVIIGQDPYHGEGQANGLAFSVNNGVRIPPSLRNMYKELHDDCGCNIPSHGDLTHWARQGVLLINSVLTVEEAKAGSHRKLGWQKFTDEAIQKLSEKREGIIFLLWGNYAIEKSGLIDSEKHHILTAMHPSPLSAYRGFFGCRHFSKVNDLLIQQGKQPIDWQIPI